jgi:hypothetical protein
MVMLHLAPTYSSWLNQVELWFAKIQRDVIARGIFAAVANLGRNCIDTFARIRKLPNHSVGPIAMPGITLVTVSVKVYLVICGCSLKALGSPMNPINYPVRPKPNAIGHLPG